MLKLRAETEHSAPIDAWADEVRCKEAQCFLNVLVCKCPAYVAKSRLIVQQDISNLDQHPRADQVSGAHLEHLAALEFSYKTQYSPPC